MAFIFIVLSFFVGVLFFSFLDSKKQASGFVFFVFSFGLGLAVSGHAVLVLALVLKSLFWGLSIFSILGVISSGLFFMKFLKILNNRLVPQKPKWSNAFLFLMAAAIVVLGLQSMLFDAEGLPFGVLKGWGDGAYHLNMIQRLATADPFLLDQPTAGGRVLSYPLLVNFISAILLKGGLSLPIAWHLPTLIFGLGLVLGLFELGRKFLTKKFLALAFVFLVLFGAGLGYFQFFKEAQKDAAKIGWTNSLVNNFLEPKYEYSHLDSRTGGKPNEKNLLLNIVWIVPAISFFSHQRSFVVGGFLGVLFLLGLIRRSSRAGGTRINEGDDKLDYKYFFVLALMPLAHTHSFLALAIFALALIVFSGNFIKALKNKYSYLAGLVALPQLAFIYLALKLNGGHEIVPWFGWMACTHRADPFICDPGVLGTDSSILWFWLKNFGVIFVVWSTSLIINGLFTTPNPPVGGEGGRVKELKTKQLVWPSIVLFVLPNLFLFQPWEFDNNKIIFWWWVLAILLSLNLFVEKGKLPEIPNDKSQISNKFQRSNSKTEISKKLPSILSRLALVIFVITSSFAGVIDAAYRLQSGLSIEKNERNFGYYGEEEIKISNWIKENTKPNDIFLTSTSPTQFVPMLSGRPIYLGFTGWLWTQGGDGVVQDRKSKINEFVFSGSTEKLCQDGVGYWLADRQFFREYLGSEQRQGSGEKVFELGQEKILKLDCGS